MVFCIKKTTELTDEEKLSLLDCFMEVFRQERSLKEMCNQYLNTPMGYCIHSFCQDKGRIVASHTAFPSYYWVGEQKIKAYITGDTMVRRGYRDGAVYLDVTCNLSSYMKNEGYALSFGFPNENTYAINKKGRLSVEIGRLDTYVLPYRIGGIMRSLRWLNPISKFFCRLWVFCSSIGGDKRVSVPLIHKDEESYNLSRYKRLDGNYSHITNDNSEFYYKIRTHEGVRTAFIIDVIGKSDHSCLAAVRYILEFERNSFDLIMFVGHLPVGVHKIGLIKVPKRMEPKHFYMTGKVIDKERVDPKSVYDINNWDVNLSDYDLI